MDDVLLDNIHRVTRRRLFGTAGAGIGSVALASLLGREAGAAAVAGLPGLPHHEPKAKRIVMLWQGGGPSHVDLFDPKPVRKNVTPGAWFTDSVCMLRTRQMSSAMPPTCGSISLISMPAAPYRRKPLMAGTTGQRE